VENYLVEIARSHHVAFEPDPAVMKVGDSPRGWGCGTWEELQGKTKFDAPKKSMYILQKSHAWAKPRLPKNPIVTILM